MNTLSGKLGQHVKHKISQKTEDMLNFTSNSNEEYVSYSLHYLACFVTAESRFVLTSTIYKLYEEHLYNRTSLSERVGIFLNCDTDSIAFDAALATKNIQFPIGNELGTFDEESGLFNATWKEKKYPGIEGIFIIGRKAYVTFNDKQQIISRTLKGIHSKHVHLVTYKTMKQICSGNPFTINFRTIQKRKNVDKIFDTLFEAVIKKTITMSAYEYSIECKNDYVYQNNGHNLLQSPYEDDIKHFLIFVCTD